jgi:Pregnancy-associated plasma protein-A/Secretion system C-terminal sorting domain
MNMQFTVMNRFFLAVCLFATVFFWRSSVRAQTFPCATDEMRKQLILTHPEVLEYEKEFARQVAASSVPTAVARKTSGGAPPDTSIYDIPIVVHVIHDFGPENISDDRIFNDVALWNTVFAGQNADTSAVIPPFRKWIGKPNIRLHLATKDRLGNPTKGITRHRSGLTYNAGDQAKLDDWPNTSYVNIWFVNSLAPTAGGFQPAAYAYFPAMGNAMPMLDGVISFYSYDTMDKTINHELGHVFSLYHVWGNTNAAGEGTCADGGTDEVDDTPPTLGHTSCTKLYDTVCAMNNYRIYIGSNGYDSLVDYPDTANVQNIMDYSYCSKMFTRGQVDRMHKALNSDVGMRDNLWSTTNLQYTGALADRPDLAPIPEFAAVPPSVSVQATPQYFVAPNNHINAKIKFLNESWNDTISMVHWQFSNGAKIPDTVVGPITQVTNTFSQPGWASVTMTPSDTGGRKFGRPDNATTKTFDHAIFVADSFGTPGEGYFQEFDNDEQLAKWPIFNYYDNAFKWEVTNTAGYYDHYCMKYNGFDSRINVAANLYPPTGAPKGDIDDFYTLPFDLSMFDSTDNCYLNFFYSGAKRAGSAANSSDSLEIQYSPDAGISWRNLMVMKKNALDNKGALNYSYVPTAMEDWMPMSISLPNDGRNFRNGYILFRFRYHPGVGADGYSSGNNFYIDRISFNRYTAGIEEHKSASGGVVLAPNPTSGRADVVITDQAGNIADIMVTDISGRSVGRTQKTISGSEDRIEIPAAWTGAKGIYIVRTTVGTTVNTQKLVVY